MTLNSHAKCEEKLRKTEKSDMKNLANFDLANFDQST